MSSFTVPFLSQYTDIGHHEWRARGCGIASLHMVLAYWHSRDHANVLPTLDELLKSGLQNGAYREGIGWSHTGLVDVARACGYEGHNDDYGPKSQSPKSVRDAWSVVTEKLRHGPIMASMYAGLDPLRGGGHLVVICGIGNGIVQFNDPQELTEREGRRTLAEDIFVRAYKNRSIIIHPR